MANLKLSQLTDGGTLTTGDLILASKGSVSNSILFENLSDSIMTAESLEVGAEVNAAENLSGTGENVYADAKNGSALQFKQIAVTAPLGVTSDAQNVIISWSIPARVIEEKTSNHQLQIGDENKYLRCNTAGGFTLTVPTNATAAFPIGTEIHGEQTGAGTVTVASTATVNSSGSSPATRAQFSGFTLIKTDTDVWTLHGDLVTA